MYDIFLLSYEDNFSQFNSLVKKFPYIKKANSLEDARNKTLTPMFFVIWDNIEIIDDSIFSIVFSIDNKYDLNENHVWLNYCGDATSYRNGVVLFSIHKPVSDKEIHYKSLINRKEYDQAVSRLRYPRYYLNTHEDYLHALKDSKHPMFWAIWNEITVTDESIFNLYFDPFNGIYDYDRNMNHVFKNKDIEEEKYNGIMLMSKNKSLPKREIDFRFVVDKKEHNRVVSKLKPYDIFFISYDEVNADKNYKLLLDKKLENNIHRVHGVKGIHQAHLAAAKLSTTPMFWVADGDAVVLDSFKFDHLIPRHDRYIVHVWHSQNPVNGLEYGYGGIKLLPKKQTLEMDLNSADMTVNISTGFRVMPEVSNITEFNVDAFSTWRSAFRECVKLSSKIILGQVDDETELRLNTWCTKKLNTAFSDYAILGANAGKEYGTKNAGNVPALCLINDFSWLKVQFDSSAENIGNIFEITSAQALATS
jgi:hypothetical protein